MQIAHASPSVVTYRDRSFRLIACLIGTHIILLTGTKVSTLEAFTIKSYYPTMAINYVIALILAWIVKRVTVKLDRRISWEAGFWSRLMLQLFFGVILVSMVCFLLVFIYFRSFGRSIMASTYPVYQFPLSVALLTILNAFYVIYYFYNRVRFLAASAAPEVEQIKSIPVQEGKEKVFLPAQDIAYIFLVEKGVLVRTHEKKDYLCECNLDELEGQLPADGFFRINRRMIASRQACRSYQSLEHGKLELSLVPSLSQGVTVSQRKAAAFKDWIR